MYRLHNLCTNCNQELLNRAQHVNYEIETKILDQARIYLDKWSIAIGSNSNHKRLNHSLLRSAYHTNRNLEMICIHYNLTSRGICLHLSTKNEFQRKYKSPTKYI